MYASNKLYIHATYSIEREAPVLLLVVDVSLDLVLMLSQMNTHSLRYMYMYVHMKFSRLYILQVKWHK